MSETWSGGKLIFSDSPESPNVSGKLYEDGTLQATGDATPNRIFLYHVNGSDGNRMKFTVLLENMGTSTGTLTIQRRGTAGATSSYLFGGKVAFQRWLTSRAAEPETVAAGSTIRLDPVFDSTTAAKNYLLHGIWDYTFDQPHKIIICSLFEEDDPLSVCPVLPVLCRDIHQRGTFTFADKTYDSGSGVVVDTRNGIQQLPIAGNTTDDASAVGIDQTDGSSLTLEGNYGVLYRIHLCAQSSDGQNLAFVFNPRGGAWGGAVNALPGITPGGIFLVPSAESLADNTKGAVEGRYWLDYPLSVWLEFMPTGGSSFPVRFVSIPYYPINEVSGAGLRKVRGAPASTSPVLPLKTESH